MHAAVVVFVFVVFLDHSMVCVCVCVCVSTIYRHGVHMKRYTLNDIIRLGKIDVEQDNALCIEGKEVSLFYFR